MTEQQSEIAAAEKIYQQAQQAWQSGHADEAISLMRQCILIAPDQGEYYPSLAVMLKGRVDDEERAQLYEKAITLLPNPTHALSNYAALQLKRGLLDSAQQLVEKALALSPTTAEAWFNQAEIHKAKTQYTAAVAAYQECVRLLPKWLIARQASLQLSLFLNNSDLILEASEGLIQHCFDLVNAEELAGWWYQAALVWQTRQDLQKAATYFETATKIFPEHLASWIELGNLLTSVGRFDQARSCYQRVLDVAPDEVAGHINMGAIYQTLGKHDRAISFYKTALALDKTILRAWSNLCVSLCYSPKRGNQLLRRTLSDFDKHLALPLLNDQVHALSFEPERPLRVAYVSADFRKHAVAYFALPLIANHDPSRYEVICYYNHRQEDEWTVQFQAAAKEWHQVSHLSDEELAQKIRVDRIDILVDLSGHTEGNRLLVFARKPAPVQVTWMGYVTSTGVSAIDYRLTHLDADPLGVEADYSEALVRLPGTMWCYQALPHMPEVSPPPVLQNGYITFGSFNRFSKVTTEVLRCWLEILLRVPESRLIMCLPEGEMRGEIAQFFSSQGVAENRIQAYWKLTHEKFWELHSKVDIALDTFPFNGGTTTCETLWLGVPLVTCTGGEGSFESRFSSRMSYAFLKSLGLHALAGKTEADYVSIAVALAHDQKRLVELRSQQRELMARAPLTDVKRFAEEVEDAYRIMWRTRCAQTNPTSAENS